MLGAKIIMNENIDQKTMGSDLKYSSIYPSLSAFFNKLTLYSMRYVCIFLFLIIGSGQVFAASIKLTFFRSANTKP